MDIPAYTPMVRDFDEIATLDAVPSSGFTEVVSFTCPDGQQGYLQSFGQGAASGGAWTSTRWRIVRSGEVRLVYPAIAQVATLLPSDLTPLHVWFSAGEKVAVQVANNDASNTLCVAARIKGIFFPEMNPRQ